MKDWRRNASKDKNIGIGLLIYIWRDQVATFKLNKVRNVVYLLKNNRNTLQV